MLTTAPVIPATAAPAPGLLTQQALPAPATVMPVVKAVPPPKHFLAAFFLSLFLGVFGADRFYLGYYGQGILKLITFGWFGIGAMVDLGIIMGGGMRTATGAPLAGYDDYKGLAKRTIGWLTAAAVAVIVLLGISVAVSISLLMSSGLFNVIGTGLSAESGGAVSLPGSSPSAEQQQYQDILKQLQ